MTRFSTLLFVPVVCGLAFSPAEAAEPLRALLATGGCCHDYESQKQILTERIGELIDVEWTVVHQGGSATNVKIPLYQDADWANGFDIVVHNECFAGVTDPEWTRRILAPHRAGVPAVVIHCAMHCYRDKTDQWFEFLGVTSHRHGARYAFEVEPIERADGGVHPIMKDFGASWMTPKGELYLISKVWPNAKPLAHAMSRDTKKREVCVWTNTFGEGRVFGTTIGHHNETMSDPRYVRLIARGMLWAVDRLDGAKLKTPTARLNLARGKPSEASSEQDQSRRAASGNDGSPSSRWCAMNASAPQWWRVDLGKVETITGCSIVWEHAAAYRYAVDVSENGESWTTVADLSRNTERKRLQKHAFDAKGRHLRVNVRGLPPGSWASFFELEVHGDKLVPTPTAAEPAASATDALLADVRAPAELDVSIFAAPPLVSYPTGVAAAATGEVYVAMDLNSSLDRRPDRGSIVHLVDENDDGRADRAETFVESIDSPRGMCHAGDRLYVVHPPYLSAFRDRDGDGKVDSKSTLIKGLGFDLGFRGADHTSNGVRIGIDGWLYLAIGDYGLVDAVAKDGGRLQLLGGGIVRVRPDGSRLELFARGLRNVYDIAVSPLLDCFTRDNTNDGGGWDIRLSHITPTANFGYPTLFVNFSGEIVPPLAIYGGGSGTGSLFVDEPGLPAELGEALYTADWGRSKVYRHPIERGGATFTAGQESFLDIPRPTDLDVDGRGRIFVGSWKGGMYTYANKPIGFVARLAAKGASPALFPDLARASDAELVAFIDSPSHVSRLNAQREILRRGPKDTFANALRGIAGNSERLGARVAALFTLALLLNEKATGDLVDFAKDETLREFALRALADARRLETPSGPFLRGLSDSNDRVRLQAIVGAGHLKLVAASDQLLEIAAETDPVLSQAAVNALRAIGAVEPCLAAIGSPSDVGHLTGAALRVLHGMHRADVVSGLIAKYDSTDRESPRGHRIRLDIVRALIRLYHHEAEWKGQWWGTRPDTRGPYYRLATWSESERIGSLIERALDELGGEATNDIVLELRRHRVEIEAAEKRLLELARSENALRAKAVEMLAEGREIPESAVPALVDAAGASALDIDVRKRALLALLRARGSKSLQAAARVLSHDDSLAPVWNEFVTAAARSRNTDSFFELTRADENPPRELAYSVLLTLESSRDRRARRSRRRARDAIQAAWKVADTTESLLRAIGRLGRKDMAGAVRERLDDEDADVRTAAYLASRQLEPDRPKPRDSVDSIPVDKLIARLEKTAGDAAIGKALFTLQRCSTCHTVAKSQPPRGPYLGGISARYAPKELATSVLQPSATVAQGFATNVFVLKNGQTYTGFVTREGSEDVEIRTGDALAVTIPKDDIRQRSTTTASVMPEGLVAELSVDEVAGLLAYIRGLKDE